MAASTITGKTVVVAGGSRGIGLEWVALLLEQGNTVVATARNPAASPGLQKLAAEAGDKLVVTELDAASPDSITAWAQGLKDTITHVDVLVFNAGVLTERMQDKLADITPKLLADTFSTNTFGPFLTTQELFKQGLLGGEGTPTLCVYMTSIVASVGGLYYADFHKLYAYRASKAALNLLIRTAGVELAAHNVTTVLMHPGYVATDMTDNGSVNPGAISTAESVTSMLKILEDGRPISGKFFSYTGEELEW